MRLEMHAPNISVLAKPLFSAAFSGEMYLVVSEFWSLHVVGPLDVIRKRVLFALGHLALKTRWINEDLQQIQTPIVLIFTDAVKRQTLYLQGAFALYSTR